MAAADQGPPDVIVIGSGFGGSVTAARLAEEGFSVTLLERGPWRDTVPVRSMGIDERAPLPRGLRLFTGLLRSLGGNAMPGGRVRLNKFGLFELFFGKGIHAVCSSGVGGGSHVYSAVNVRPRVDGYWDGHDDAVSTQGMEPHYQNVLERMGAMTPTAQHRIPNTFGQRFRDSNILEPSPPPPDTRLGYLLPEDPKNPKKVTTVQGIERWEVDYEKGNDGFLGSPDGGKTTLDFAYLAPAMKKGLSVKDLCEVRAIVRQTEEGRARYRIEYIDHHGGRDSVLEADNVVLAAGTLNTLRILFYSRDVRGGLSGMPRLGKRFGTNGDFFAYWDYNEPGTDLSQGLPVAGAIQLRDEIDPPTVGGGGFPSTDAYPLPRPLRNRLKRANILTGMGEDAMDGEVTFAGGKMKIEYEPANSPVFARLRATYEKISHRTGRKAYLPRTPMTVHPTGGACFAASIDDGVVDSNGEVFDNEGLFVADAAALPRTPGGPPAITIAAWADRLASCFIERHRVGA
jgi:cholesterol oxidase